MNATISQKLALGCALTAASLVAGSAYATIMFTTPSMLTSFTTNGMGVVSPGPPLPINFVDTVDGFKVTGYTLTYNPIPPQNNTVIHIDWFAQRGLNASGAADMVQHFNHLDGSVSYSPNFQLLDVSLRTITTATDYDLCALHLGNLGSGSSFDKNLLCGAFPQPTGDDLMLQMFSMFFFQGPLATVNDFITINLPNSAESALAGAVPVPGTLWLFGIALAALGWRRQREVD